MSSFIRRQLGRTGLEVSPLGIGGGSGIASEDLFYAFEHGINYFFFSSDLHHCTYQKSVQALKMLCGRASSVREQVVLATVSYVNNPKKVLSILVDQFSELDVDYIDVFHWGWVSEEDDVLPLIKMAKILKGPCSHTKFIRQMQMLAEGRTEQALAINEELLKRGLVRHVGASFHSRSLARAWMRNLDVLMLRYNIAHLGAEQDVAPFLYGEKSRDPGMVVFNVGHIGPRPFHIPPPGWPAHRYVPSIPDCYRFALSQSWVDLVLTGMANRQQIDQALAALEQGPLSEQECQQLREYGAQYEELLSSPSGLALG